MLIKAIQEYWMNAPSFEDLLERIASVSQEFLPKCSTVATHSNVYSQNQTSGSLPNYSTGAPGSSLGSSYGNSYGTQNPGSSSYDGLQEYERDGPS